MPLPHPVQPEPPHPQHGGPPAQRAERAIFPVQPGQMLTLAAIPNSVPLARRLVSEVARRWRLSPAFGEDAELVISELVTNAVRATQAFHQARGLPEVGRVKVRLRWTRPSLVTEVWDINPLLPVRKPARDDAESGRGLGIIEMLCANWAAHYCPEGGKVVWAEQRLPD